MVQGGEKIPRRGAAALCPPSSGPMTTVCILYVIFYN